MVVHDLTENDINQVFRALADATRRDILRRTIAGDLSVSTVASYYDMSFAAVQKHVSVLQAAGLVTKVKNGRERLVQADRERIAQTRALLTQLEGLWKERGTALDELFAQERGGQSE